MWRKFWQSQVGHRWRYNAARKRCDLMPNKAREQAHSHNIWNLLFHNWLIPSDIVKKFHENTKTGKLYKDLFNITICLAKLYVWSRLWAKERSFFFVTSTQHQALCLKTYVRFIVADDIDLTQKHCCATLNIFTYLTVTCSFILRSECIVVFPLQNGYANVPQYCFTYTAYLVTDFHMQWLNECQRSALCFLINWPLNWASNSCFGIL